ncbi:MAG: hypothetical protein A2W25_04360 [candidate division Zixibacteria bacterium RBG_16_53_22]|nr:MAG: hypothetical protein A2W25_04360 [candidate division Zixibacteria bacterium RBG_16_53_22]
MATEHGMVKNLSEQEMYEMGLVALKEHIEETLVRVMKSRKEHNGNFKYIEGEDFMRERRIANTLQIILSHMDLKLRKRQLVVGECGAICVACTARRFNMNSKKAPDHWANEEKEGWMCQVECECK